MSLEDRHALVLGASGFIGRHLVLALGQAGCSSEYGQPEP